MLQYRPENAAILDLLTPKIYSGNELTRINAIQKRLNEIIYKNSEGLAEKHQLRLPQIQALLGLQEQNIWFPVPGMYSGFNLSLKTKDDQIFLISESWSRVVEGSGMRYAIYPDKTVILEEGFV